MTGPINTTQKSASLIAIEKQLQDVEARIAADRKRRDAEMKAAIEQARRDAEAIKKLKGEKNAIPTVPNTPNPSHQLLPTTSMSISSPSIIDPVGPACGNKELPESALFLLRDLWSHLGYSGDAFIEMQMEIGRELDRADFARFEREMLCNECTAARMEIQMLREERGQLSKRLELNRETINQISETEERTYKTLMAERATSENVIRAMEAEIRELRAHRETANNQIEALSNNLERCEKSRLAAVLYAKGAEERVSAANATAAAAVEVANRHMNSPHPSPGPPMHSSASYWAVADDEILKTKLKERILAVEEEKLASELAKVKDQREKLKLCASPKPPDSTRPKESKNGKDGPANNQKGNEDNSENTKNNKNNKNKNHNKNNDQNTDKNDQNNKNNNQNNKNNNQSDKNNEQNDRPTQSQNNSESHKARKSYIMDLF